MVIVRENNEGEYSEIGGRLHQGTDDELAVQESVFTRRGTDRVIAYACELAATRSGRICSATKSNGIIHTMPFWDERFAARRPPGTRSSQTEQVLIDALAAMVVLDPGRFDVIVASNLFGDILSDLAAAVAGSIGIAPSGNLNPEREFPSMFEPVHGSAPDIAGQGIANPIGAIWSGAQMLEHLGEEEAAAAVLDAIEEMLASDGPRTRDLGGTATTADVTAALDREFRERLRRGSARHEPSEGESRGDALERIAQVGTYRTLGEQKLSPQEERFEKARRTIGLFLAPAVFLIFLLLPLDMDETQQKLAAALLFVVVLWITEAVPIPIGGLLGIALIVLIGVAPADDVLAPFGSTTIFVFIGAFIIAQAMLRHGLARRFAFRVLADPRRRQEHDAHDHRLRRRSPACCRRSSPTPRRWRCCCRPRSRSSARSRT